MKLTKEQQEVVKALVPIAGNMADQILSVMKNHELDKIDGCELTIDVRPEYLFSTEFIQFGNVGKDSGIIRMGKGRRSSNEKWVPIGKNTAEYELLFADESIRSRMEEIMFGEKELPPDGLCVGDFDDSDPVVDRGNVSENPA